MTVDPREALVAHPATGEVIDLATAQTDELARFAAIDLQEIRDAVTDAETAISAELVSRLDRRGEWTLRVGDPAGPHQYEIKSQSPTAGTTGYDVEALREQLLALLDEKAIDDELARAVVRRRVTITCEINVDVGFAALEAALRGLHAIAGTPVFDPKVELVQAVQAAGVNRLRKAGHASAVEAAVTTLPAPHRKAKVTVKRKA